MDLSSEQACIFRWFPADLGQAIGHVPDLAGLLGMDQRGLQGQRPDRIGKAAGQARQEALWEFRIAAKVAAQVPDHAPVPPAPPPGCLEPRQVRRIVAHEAGAGDDRRIADIALLQERLCRLSAGDPVDRERHGISIPPDRDLRHRLLGPDAEKEPRFPALRQRREGAQRRIEADRRAGGRVGVPVPGPGQPQVRHIGLLLPVKTRAIVLQGKGQVPVGQEVKLRPEQADERPGRDRPSRGDGLPDRGKAAAEQ